MSYLDFMTKTIDAMSDSPVKAYLRRTISTQAAFEQAAVKFASDQNLSPSGVVNEGRKHLKAHAHELVRVRKIAERASAHIADQRSKLKLQAVDPTDAASAILRGQVRDKLAGKSSKEIAALAPSLSPLFLSAIIEAPELLGIDQNAAEAVRDAAIERAYPGELAKLRDQQDAVNLLINAIRPLADAARSLAGLPNEHALNEFVNEAVPDQRHIEADVERSLAA
ncbi:hypothetical protein JQ615_01105 [Bradyrhizobium jicamae]|uniref:Terminase small subunit n=1 Tax=Bradyrhizobium jicamae TaxID=280332 RepID=A0ABS5FB21_9BRAD|nr:hypothetical protein [Bradyrhizobium jicamae]MBR0793979.1 hypothetical protein [Bradyrhizobium jicamae]